MPRLSIDNREVEVDGGSTILDAAEKLGIKIPTLCFLKGSAPSTSCMVCVVKVAGSRSLLPACATVAVDGMRVESDCEEVLEARKAALELLLSDHVGDCMGPCQIACPARMNIPLMIRQIAGGRLRDAIATVKQAIPLPGVLGRICPKPCEKVCRRRIFDEAVSICLLKRYVAEVDLRSDRPYLPECKAARGKRVAVVGAGPAGLAAAYYLRQEGFACTIFDRYDAPGGALRYEVGQDRLPREVLDAETAFIRRLEIEFRGRTTIGKDLSIRELLKNFDAVFLAIGKMESGEIERLGLEAVSSGVAVDLRTYQTGIEGVFAGGGVVRNRRLAVRAVADGKEAAVSIVQYLLGAAVTGPKRVFNTRMGKLKDGELEVFLRSASERGRARPSGKGGGLSSQQVLEEAGRCLHCDCRKADECKLRRYAQDYMSRAGRYGGPRRLFSRELTHPEIIYEAGKCIGCGICIRLAAEANEELGLSFVGRSFDVRVAVPFGRSLGEGLRKVGRKCAEACPTGALAIRD